MSSTKPVAVIAIMQLWEKGLVDLETPVAEYVPEFGANGKGGVLVEHLLTHTAGFPYADAHMWADRLHEWKACLAAICKAPLAGTEIT